ncbi:hypothetical protein LOAG_16625 [Loa loa]|uniref:Major sperm protein n=1 Tax=Loa loa TaxID=7209 RepID=A0A1S0UL69_LOALO|nr:hypothetical protein LOAG_16625 [Loa loa]EJD76450.1 hypothetical protein LOAG_16625 [Loa loa]
MGSVDRKSVPLDNTLSGSPRRLSQMKQHAREWIANKQSRCRRTSEDITFDTVGCGGTMLDNLKTIPKENCTATGLSITRLNPTTIHSTATQSCPSKTTRSRRLAEDERTETAEQSLTLTGRTFNENHQLTDCMENPASNIEGLVSYPSSQVMIWSCHTGPVILAFTNNYKKPVVWALKTNAIRRLAAFPTTGIIPPSETVQIKIDLVGQIPKKNLKDRLSLEYFFADRKFLNDGNYYNFFHRSESTRMRKCLEVVYVQQ